MNPHATLSAEITERPASAYAGGESKRATLRRDLDGLARNNRDIDSDAVRRRLVERLREFRTSEFEGTWRSLRKHPRQGRSCATAIASFHDDILAELYRFVCRYVFRRPNPSEGERLAIAATGGYGRGTLAPASDLDLLFLHPYKSTPWEEALVEYMLLTLWDIGLVVGHASRSPQGSLLAARNIANCTAMLDARLVAGDGDLFADWQAQFHEHLASTNGADFIDAKLNERDERHHRFGASRYLVEPNVKESKGGLRDLDTLFWLAKYACRLRKPSEMVRAGLFTQEDYAVLRACYNFLWATRCELHFWSKRAEDRLTFEAQLHIAQAWGFKAESGLSAVECFMKRYFNVARQSGRLTRILCAELEQQGNKRPPKVLASRRVADIDVDDFNIKGGRLNARADDIFEKDSVNFIRLFLVRATHRVTLHPHLVTLLAAQLHRIDSELCNDVRANRLFLECLLSPDAANILREMNETGVLGRFIPEFGRIVGLMQFGMYHHYTVDEHSLNALQELRRLEHGDSEKELPLASSLVHRKRNRAALSLAVFLHDVAKGSRQDHSVAGAKLAKRIAGRLGLPAQQADTAAWLVQNHLLMSDFAQKRDIQDSKTIEDFAARVGSPERLRLLLLLTVVDIRAVGPGVWNGWKGTLLRRLYHIAQARLTGHSSPSSGDVDIKRNLLAGELSHWSKTRLENHLGRFSAYYWSAFDTRDHKRHADMINEVAMSLPHDEAGKRVRMMPDKFRSATEMICYQHDRPGLFASITGTCASANVSIVDARLFTTEDNMALDVFRLREHNGGAIIESSRLARLHAAVCDALEDAAPALLSRPRTMPRQASREAFDIEGEVWVDNDASLERSVIEISGLDRPGLLFELARALFELNLKVASAHVATFGERAFDVFYVREENGGKIKSGARQKTVRTRLLQALRP